MNQPNIIKNIRQKLDFNVKELAEFCCTAKTGVTYRMSKNTAGQPAARLFEIISALLDEMPESKIKKIKKNLAKS